MYSPPPKDCPRCPRLVAFRQKNQHKFPDKYNGAVPPFGPITASLLVVGLAPGLKGANFTGRPFTGDYAGDVLYPSLVRAGFARGEYQARPDDGLEMLTVRITNAVRCVPPQNKPVGEEMANCLPFLQEEIAAMPELKAILALGGIAHKQTVKAFEKRQVNHPFGHRNRHDFGNVTVFDSYHCSRYNINTGRLTVEMFDDVLADINAWMNNKTR